AGAAHFRSEHAPWIEKSKPYGDQAAQCVRAARSAGIEVHLWKVCWNLAMAPAAVRESLRREGRLQKNSRGETRDWLCPSDPVNTALELNSILEALGRYGPDGIHLDYIRYPDGDACYCAGCRARFEQWSGKTVEKWPSDVVSGSRRESYKSWRKAQITNFIRTVRREMKKAKPAARLSAAVYPKYPECAESIGQDWGLWLKEGAVDFVCPMDYFPSTSLFAENLGRQLAMPNGAKRVYPGIGATLEDGDLGRQAFIGQLKELRERGAGGFVLFDLNHSLAENFLPLIGK
ncbi:MAG: family 10 glycosylhydrolase, partial [Kiritimatiellia bacterium]